MGLSHISFELALTDALRTECHHPVRCQGLWAGGAKECHGARLSQGNGLYFVPTHFWHRSYKDESCGDCWVAMFHIPRSTPRLVQGPNK